MEELTAHVLVIGSGLAGILAALEAEKSGLQALMVGKFSIGMGTNTSLANGVFTAPNSQFSKEDHLRVTLEAGKGLNRVQLVKRLADEGADAMERLKSYGVPVVERRVGYVLDRPRESCELPGILLIKALRERLKASEVKMLPGLTVLDLIVEEGKVQGAFGFLKDGRPCLIKSKAIVLAAGGAGAIYGRNDNQRSIWGDGYALALRAGLPIFDMEFVQFFPFVLAEPRLSTFILILPHPEEIRLFNEKGEDLLVKLGVKEDLYRAIATERDRLSIALYEASQKGDVYLDLTRISEEKWRHYPLNFLKRSKFPFRERPFLVAPAAHFFMGGVEVDSQGKTTLPGLFAAGEVVWGVHGANRHGGNALTECAVFGNLAGRSAVEYVQTEGEGTGPSNLVAGASTKRWEKKAGAYLKKARGISETPKDMLQGLKALAWRHAGPVREEGLLKEGLEHIASFEKRIERVYPNSVKELFERRTLENGVLLLRAILKGSLLRTESRGSFFRQDFQRQDDQRWLKNTCYSLVRGELQITYKPADSESPGDRISR